MKQNILSENMFPTTKISKSFQTVVPSQIRKSYNIEHEDIIEWIDEGDSVRINIRKKVTDEDILGILSGNFKYDSVKLKKMHKRMHGKGNKTNRRMFK